MERTRNRRRRNRDRKSAGDQADGRRGAGAARQAGGEQAAQKGRIQIRSYAKINLSIDVGGRQPDGFHPVDMIMQQLAFHDDVLVRVFPDPAQPDGKFTVTLHTNLPYLPTDDRNLAVQAANLMAERYGRGRPGGQIRIDLKKRIPVAAGLAGGSGNGAAVVHGLNALWDLGLSLPRIMKLCGELGSDVPFCAMGQADANRVLPDRVRFSKMASSAARATGRGTELAPFRGCSKPVVIGKPRLSVSTAEVYRGIDDCEVTRRPDNDRLRERILAKDPAAYEDFINVLEAYTLQHYPKVRQLKEDMAATGAKAVLMSGSGPTVFAVYDEAEEAGDAAEKLHSQGWDIWQTKTMA